MESNDRLIRVMHVEQYAFIRDGLRALLQDDPMITIVGQAADKRDLLALLAQHTVDVVVIGMFLDDISYTEDTGGIEMCALVRKHYPDVHVIAHSAFDDALLLSNIIKHGARGFVSKRSQSSELVKAIKDVYAEEIYICEHAQTGLKNLKRFLAGLDANLIRTNDTFSNRERQVLALLAQGLSSREIADELRIAERTIEKHRGNMMEKTRAKNSVELMVYAASQGYVSHRRSNTNSMELVTIQKN